MNAIEKKLKVYTQSKHNDGSIILTYILPPVYKGKCFEYVYVSSLTTAKVSIFIIRSGTEEIINTQIKTNREIKFSEEKHPFINAEDDFYTVAVHLSNSDDKTINVVALYSDIEKEELNTSQLTILPKFYIDENREDILKSYRKLTVYLSDICKTYIAGCMNINQNGDIFTFDYPLIPGPRSLRSFRVDNTYSSDIDIFLMYRNICVSHIPYNNFGSFAPILYRQNGKEYHLDLMNIRPEEFYIRILSRISTPPLIELKYGMRDDYHQRLKVNMMSPLHFEYTYGITKIPQRNYTLTYGPSKVLIED